jgi:hypothetical protein
MSKIFSAQEIDEIMAVVLDPRLDEAKTQEEYESAYREITGLPASAEECLTDDMALLRD